MNFETRRISLAAGAAAVDLAADSDLALTELGVSQGSLAIQNVSTRTARYAEVETAPAGTAVDLGHTLPPGAGVVVLLTLDRPFWFWSATGATIAVSEGGPALVRGGG